MEGVNFRRVQFAEAGDGCELVFRNSDLRTLFNTFGLNYMQDVELGLQRHDVDIVEKCLKIALKKNGDQASVGIDDLDHVPYNDLCEKLLDAFCLSNSGRTFEQHMEWIREKEKELIKKMESESPPMSPEDSSAVSSETPSGQGSQPTNSGE